MSVVASWSTWVGAALVALLFGAAWCANARSAHRARFRALASSGVALVACVAAWVVHVSEVTPTAPEPRAFLGLLALDRLGALMLPHVALVAFVTILGTLRTKAGRLNFPRILVQALLHVALFCSPAGWSLIALLVATAIPPAFDLRERGASVRLYGAHQGVAAVALALGWALADAPEAGPLRVGAASALLLLGVVLRCGLFPGHAWVTDLFDLGPMGGALLATVPLGGVVGVVRLLPGHAAPWASALLSGLAVLTALLAAGMTLVQRDARRFFAFFLVSNGALVVAGVSLGTPLSVTGGLCAWPSFLLAITGFGLTLRSLEARAGRLSLAGFRGMHSQTPTLAGFFLLTGLASVGFPGTIGFFGIELLVEGGQETFGFGPAVVACAALNGISVLRAYGILFLGARHPGTVDLRCRPSERLAILSLSLALIGGVLYPGPLIRSRRAAARELGGGFDPQHEPDAELREARLFLPDFAAARRVSELEIAPRGADTSQPARAPRARDGGAGVERPKNRV